MPTLASLLLLTSLARPSAAAGGEAPLPRGEAPPPRAEALPPELIVFAPASLADALPRAAAAWPGIKGVRATFSFDATSRLAKQIEAGAPVDLFLSADRDWMDYLEGKGLLAPKTRRDLLGNRLVVAVPASAAFARLADIKLAKRVALAGENVPAGKYARAALESAGLWGDLEPRIVRADHVRLALKWVADGEADAGLVYETDAAAEPSVRAAFVFPEGSHPSIVYPAAVLKRSRAAKAAGGLLDYLAGEEAAAVLRKLGFSRPPAAPGAARPAPRRPAAAPRRKDPR